jgi:hypothetical protein
MTLVLGILSKEMAPGDVAGIVRGDTLQMTLRRNKLDNELDTLRDTYLNTLEKVLDDWQK